MLVALFASGLAWPPSASAEPAQTGHDPSAAASTPAEVATFDAPPLIDEWSAADGPGTAFANPFDIAARDGRIYVADDTGTAAFNRWGVRQADCTSTKANRLDVAPGGDLYQLDAPVTRTRELERQNHYCEPVANLDPAPDDRDFFKDVAVAPDGDAVVIGDSYTYCARSDVFDHCLEWRTEGYNGLRRFDPSGDLVTQFPVNGRGGVAVTEDRVYIARPGQVLAYTAAGVLLGSTDVGGMANDVDVDAAGNVYVAVGLEQIKVYSPTGTLLSTWPAPVDRLSVDPADGSVYVADTSGDRVLHYGFGLSGAVTSSGTGAPIEGAWVLAIDDQGGVAGGTLTDGAGHYELGVGIGTFRLEFVDPSGDHVGEWYQDTPLGDPGGSTPVTVSAGGVTVDAALDPTAATGSVAGHLTAPGGGALSGIWVAAVRADDGSVVGSAVTDGSGGYRIDGLAPGGHLLVFVDPHAAHALAFYDGASGPGDADPVTVEAGSTTIADAVLDPVAPPGGGATIAGTVTDDASGAAVGSAWAVAVDATGTFAGGAVTDGAGHYSLSVAPGTYRVELVDPSGAHTGEWYENTPLDAIGAATPVTVASARTATVDAALAPTHPTGAIGGTVRDVGFVGALPGIWVVAVSTNSGRPAGSAITGGTGDYTIDGLAPGSYWVVFVDPRVNRAFEFYDDAVSAPGALAVVVSAGATSDVDAGLGPRPPDRFASPWGVDVASDGEVFVADTANHRITRTHPGVDAGAWGTHGTGPGQFESPAGVEWSPTLGLLVADTGNNRIQRFTRHGSHLASFGTAGSGPGQFDGPTGVDATAGIVFVADTGNHRIEAFQQNGTFVSQFGSLGAGSGQLDAPYDLAIAQISGPDLVFVADGGDNDRVTVFTTGGGFVRQFGGHGTGPGQFLEPSGIAVDPTLSSVYVTDDAPSGGTDRVQQFSFTGDLLASWGAAGAGEFDALGGVAVDAGAQVWVADGGANNCIDQFTSSGSFLASLSSPF